MADLHKLQDVLVDTPKSDGLSSDSDSNAQDESALTSSLPSDHLPEESLENLAKLESTLKRHDLWLGYSETKGWVIRDGKLPENANPYGWCRVFSLLRDGSADRLSRADFSAEPRGPWSLHFWKNLDISIQRRAGPAFALMPAVEKYLQDRTRVAQQRLKQAAERDEDWACRIGEPEIVTHEQYLQQSEIRRAHYAEKLPARVSWIKRLAKAVQEGEMSPEPAHTRGKTSGDHLQKNGISHLWHFTDLRNLDLIRREEGLLSSAGLVALNINDAHLVSDEFSRSCDARLDRERYVRLSFIPNSWFFQRVRWQSQLVWLRFSLQTLSVGEVFYTLGNAASSHVVLQEDLQSMGIDWEQMVKPFSGTYTDDKGPTSYRRLYDRDVSSVELFREISNAWNSEILIKHFIPLKFCDRVFDARTGKPISL